MLDGIRIICKKLQYKDSYIWLKIVPLIEILCHCLGGAKSIVSIEPRVNTFYDAEKKIY